MSFDVEEVLGWLGKIPIPVSEAVKERLIEEEIDVKALRGLTGVDLSQLGFVKMGHRSKILLAVAAIAPVAAVVPPPPPLVPPPAPAARKPPMQTPKADKLLAAVKEQVAGDIAVAEKIEAAPLTLKYYALPKKTLDGMPWWACHEAGKGTFCKVCISAGVQAKNMGGTWTTNGSNNEEADGRRAFTKHEGKEGSTHNDALKKLEGQCQIDGHMDAEGEKVVSCLRKRACDLYHLMKNNVSLRQFVNLLELEEINGAYKDEEGACLVSWCDGDSI
jgi:hypothetical protein